MNEYSISYSKTDEDHILENHHVIRGTVPWNTLETKKHIVKMLTEKEQEIDRLTKENDFLKWYCEELEVHLPKETVKQIKEFYQKEVKK